jgi:Tfp pilus assembly protein PilV
MTCPDPSPGRRGYSLVELIFALLIFQVGILGVAGMILTAQQSLTRAQLILRGTLEARMTGDSLLAEGVEESGEAVRPWGTLAWTRGGTGELKVVAVTPGGGDTLAALRIWPPVGDAMVEFESEPTAGGGGE